MNSKVNQGLKEVRWAFRRDATPRTAGAITKVGGGYAIADTSTTAQVGDIYRPETATTAKMVNKEYKIIAASTNSFTIASKDLPVLGDTFYIMGFVTPKVDDKGVISVSATQGPTQYVYNGSDIEVALDTTTAANSRPLPIWYINGAGSKTDLATLAEQQTQTASLSVLDDWDESDRAKVNIIAGQAGVAAGIGNSSASTPRVVLASDQPLIPTNLFQVGSTSVATGSGAVNTGTQRVILATDQTSIPATQSGTWNIGTTTTVTTVGTVTNITNQGHLVDNAAFTDGTTRLMMGGYIFDETAGTALTENDAGAARIDSKRAQVGVIEDATTRGQRMAVSAAGAASINLAQIAGNTTLAGAGTDGTGSQRITHSSGATATLANVNDAATSATLLAASTSRLGAVFYNDSTSILYLKFGATASTTSFTVAIQPSGYYELPGPHIYNGIIDGIWSADASGACRVTSW